MANPPRPSNHNHKQKPFNTYLKYSGLAIQMAVTIGAMAWLGYKIDQWLDLSYPIFLLIFVMVGFAGSLYSLVRSLNN